MAKFSDPAWWPKPPPRPPTALSVPALIFRGLVPAIVIAAAATLVLTRHSQPTKSVRSVAAFESCIRAHTSGGATVGGRDASAEAQRSCQSFLPPGTAVGSIEAATSPRARFDDCLRNATANLPQGGFHGGYGGGSSTIFRAAVAVCQSVAHGSSATGPVPTPAGAAPPKA